MSNDFLNRRRFVRAMTVDFISDASDECLDYRPGPAFMTIREQAAHLSEVQDIYQLALGGNEADWARKPEFSRPHRPPTRSSTHSSLATANWTTCSSRLRQGRR
jgi:hypothetical protein